MTEAEAKRRKGGARPGHEGHGWKTPAGRMAEALDRYAQDRTANIFTLIFGGLPFYIPTQCPCFARRRERQAATSQRAS